MIKLLLAPVMFAALIGFGIVYLHAIRFGQDTQVSEQWEHQMAQLKGFTEQQ